MKLLNSLTVSKSRIEIFILTLTIILFISRMVSPLLKYPFFLLYFSIIVYVAIVYKGKIISTLGKFVKNYSLIGILFLILILAFSFSNKVYLSIFKDLVSIFVLLSFYFILTIIVQSKKEFSYFFDSFLNIIVLFGILISILGFIDLFNIIPLPKYVLSDGIPGGSFFPDYNFALLPVFYAFISVIYLMSVKDYSTSYKIFFNILLIVFSVHIIFSGSKRGLILMVFIILILAALKIFSLFNRKLFFKKTFSNLSFYLISVFFISISFYLFISYSSFIYKNKFFEKIGTENIIATKKKISSKLYRCVSILDNKIDFVGFYEKFWSIEYDPRDPDKGWCGLGIHKTVFPITGKNVEIVPKGSKGMLMDSTFKGDTWDGDVYSITLLGVSETEKSDSVNTSIYSYVSGDFTGSFVALVLLYTKSKEVNFYYDLDKKETWQKLIASDLCVGEEAKAFLYFGKKGETDFSKLNGHVIIAFPQFQILKSNKSSISYYNSISYNLNGNSLKQKYFQPDKDVSKVKLKPQIVLKENLSQKNPGSKENLLSYKGINSRVVNIDYNKSNIKSSFGFSVLSLFTSIINTKDNDPIRNFVAKFISEDTTYHGFSAKIVVETTSNKSIGERILRWQFAWQIFDKEYNWIQKLFGGGFNFLNWYSYYFYGSKYNTDYPHNPFLSILLYSGIFGLIIYIIFIIKVFYYYIKYFKEYKILFIFFLITFFFSFFSAGSPFDPPIMGFFAILPFFIHSLSDKENQYKLR